VPSREPVLSKRNVSLPAPPRRLRTSVKLLIRPSSVPSFAPSSTVLSTRNSVAVSPPSIRSPASPPPSIVPFSTPAVARVNVSSPPSPARLAVTVPARLNSSLPPKPTTPVTSELETRAPLFMLMISLPRPASMIPPIWLVPIVIVSLPSPPRMLPVRSAPPVTTKI